MEPESLNPKYYYEQRVLDKITRLRGRVTGVAYFFGHRPTQYLVEGIDSTGRPMAEWVDEERVEAD